MHAGYSTKCDRGKGCVTAELTYGRAHREEPRSARKTSSQAHQGGPPRVRGHAQLGEPQGSGQSPHLPQASWDLLLPPPPSTTPLSCRLWIPPRSPVPNSYPGEEAEQGLCHALLEGSQALGERLSVQREGLPPLAATEEARPNVAACEVGPGLSHGPTAPWTASWAFAQQGKGQNEATGPLSPATWSPHTQSTALSHRPQIPENQASVQPG